MLTPEESIKENSLSNFYDVELDTVNIQPVDFTEISLKINQQINRLGWTSYDTKDYLIRTYGKKYFHLLTDAQLVEFLGYLQKRLATLKIPKLGLYEHKDLLNLSEIFAKINGEINRLSWTDKKVQKYLLKTYDQKNRVALTDEELLAFFNYLETLPTPSHKVTISEANPPDQIINFADIINQTHAEGKLLGWTSQQLKDYLIQTYDKPTLNQLSDGELLEFLAYLQSLPTSESKEKTAELGDKTSNNLWSRLRNLFKRKQED